MHFRRFNCALFMRKKTHDCQTDIVFLFELKRRENENVTKNEDHEHKTIVQRTQSDHDRYAHDINNRFAESILNNEIIERKKNFSLIKFSNEKFFNTQHQKESRNNMNVANSAL